MTKLHVYENYKYKKDPNYKIIAVVFVLQNFDVN